MKQPTVNFGFRIPEYLLQKLKFIADRKSVV